MADGDSVCNDGELTGNLPSYIAWCVTSDEPIIASMLLFGHPQIGNPTYKRHREVRTRSDWVASLIE
jgi:hypothetical protein